MLLGHLGGDPAGEDTEKTQKWFQFNLLMELCESIDTPLNVFEAKTKNPNTFGRGRVR